MRKLILMCGIIVCAPLLAVAQDYPKAEVFTGYSYLRGNLNANFNGWNASVTGNVNNWFGVTADFGGHYVSGFNVHTFTFGPKFTYRGKNRVEPYFQTLFGGARFGNGGSTTAFALATGGGLDVKVNKNVAIRVIDVTYLYLRDNGVISSNGRLSTGIVWRFGEK